MSNIITDGINSIPDVEFTETKELGKVKRVDPLGITDLRIRGMWHIDNPNKIFDYLYTCNDTKGFQLVCLMSRNKYESLPLEDREALESLGVDGVEVLDVRVKSPDNPVILVEAKLLVFKS